MGSSSKPAKAKDKPIIGGPRSKTGGTGVGGTKQEDMNRTCPLFLTVSLNRNSLLHEGLALSINDKGEVTIANGTVVGRLTATQHRTVLRCADSNYKYRGKVEVRKDKTLYGQFGRYTA